MFGSDCVKNSHRKPTIQTAANVSFHVAVSAWKFASLEFLVEDFRLPAIPQDQSINLNGVEIRTKMYATKSLKRE